MTTPNTSTSHSHPIKSFFLPRGLLHQILTFPAQVIFALTGMMGLAQFSRQIVKVLPIAPASITFRAGKGFVNGAASPDQPQAQEKKEVTITDWIGENVPSLKGAFTPSWWLPNGHLQTIYSVVGDFSNVDKVDYVRTYLRVPDGGTLALDFTPLDHLSLPPETPTLVVCHGLTGGSHESYVRNVLARVTKPKSEGGLGIRGVVVNFRGCAGTPVTSPQLYSAGTTMDLATSLHYLRHIYPSSPLHGIGFSLGASVVSRYLGESSTSSLLSSAVVLGCPWDLAAMSDKLENDFWTSLIYSRAMAKNLIKLFFGNYKSNPTIFERDDSPVKEYLERLKELEKKGGTLKRVDDVMVAKIGGPRGDGMWPFPGADEYYNWACPKNLVHLVKRPLLSINAFDDPIIDGTKLPIDQFHSSTHVYAAITGSGGHLGWFSGPFFAHKKSKYRWIIEPISEYLTAAVRDLSQEGGEVKVEREEGENGTKEGLTWVVEGGHKLTNGKDGKVGWRVLQEGKRVEGAEDQGVLQGL